MRAALAGRSPFSPPRTSAGERRTWPCSRMIFACSKRTPGESATGAQDAATKKYVDAKVAGLNWKEVVRLATTGVLAANTVAGETITSTGKELLEVDGVAVIVGDRILVKNQ